MVAHLQTCKFSQQCVIHQIWCFVLSVQVDFVACGITGINLAFIIDILEMEGSFTMLIPCAVSSCCAFLFFNCMHFFSVALWIWAFPGFGLPSFVCFDGFANALIANGFGALILALFSSFCAFSLLCALQLAFTYAFLSFSLVRLLDFPPQILCRAYVFVLFLLASLRFDASGLVSSQLFPFRMLLLFPFCDFSDRFCLRKFVSMANCMTSAQKAVDERLIRAVLTVD